VCFSSWSSTRQEEKGLGNIEGEQQQTKSHKFIQCLHVHQELHAAALILEAMEAAEQEEESYRLVGFVPDTDVIRCLLDPLRTRVLASFHIHELPLEPWNIEKDHTEGMDLASKVCLIIIDNVRAKMLKVIDHTRLVNKVRSFINDPGSFLSEDKDNQCPTTRREGDHLQYFEWYSNPQLTNYEVKTPYPPTPTTKLQEVSKHNKQAGAMGIFPPNFKQLLSKAANKKVSPGDICLIQDAHIKATARNYSVYKAQARKVKERMDWFDAG
jgi:hypothetical protein